MRGQFSIFAGDIIIMGKHSKIVNNDPILKKDYKYQKRKKQRALEREAEKLAKQKQQRARQQVEAIENEVNKQIERELAQRINLEKQKKIKKIPKELLTKKQAPAPGKSKQSQADNGARINLVLPISSTETSHQLHSRHYAQLAPGIQLAKQQHESRKQQIDRQVREQIQDMFQMESGMVDAVKPRVPAHVASRDRDEASEFSNPYLLVKARQKQKQVLVNSQDTCYFTAEALENKQALVATPSTTPAESLFKPLLAKAAIQGYFDYIHIENQQEATISEFRALVMDHMLGHEQKCRATPNSNGFTNAKSVILCPFFGDARSIIEIFEAKFVDYEFVNKQKLDQIQQDNDFFRIGISINDKRKSIKYFSHFNVSNIIIGSPVGIKAIVGSEGESERDYSFLSSVEVVYIDRASVISMQNWDHLVEVIKVMNQMPSPQSICNSIDTLRPSAPQLRGKIYRQNILFSEFNFPEINSLKHIHFHNWQGCITTKPFYKPPALRKQHDFDINFYKMEIKEPKEDLEQRFEFFKRKFWEQLHNSDRLKKVVILVRSYFEFLKLKQFLVRVNASAQCISEHTKKPKVQSRVAGFNGGKFRILVLTERAYYYDICQIKKFQHLYIYSLPRNSFIYSQLLSELTPERSHVKNKVVAIYSKYDIMSLERVVGTRKAIEMVKQYCSNVSFVL